MAQLQAKCTANGDRGVIYRNLDSSGTLHRKPGEPIDNERWIAIAADNIGDLTTIYFGKGPVWQSSGSELKDGDQVNIGIDYGFVQGDHRSGLYQLSGKHDLGNGCFQFDIKRIGDIDPTKLVHLATLVGC